MTSSSRSKESVQIRRVAKYKPKRMIVPAAGFAVGAVTIFPIIFMISSAFKPTADVFDGKLIPETWTIENFTYALTSAGLLWALFISFFIATTVTVCGTLLHSMAAYALARLQFPGRDIIFFGFFATLMVSMPVILVPLFVIIRGLGLVDTFAGIVLPLMFHAFALFLLRQFFMGLPDELEEAARIDGCGYIKTFFLIALPISRPIIAALGIFMFLGAWNAFLWPLTVARSDALTPVQVAISNFQGEHTSDWSSIMAASTLAALPMLVLFLIFQKQIIESIKTGGLK